MKYKKLTKEQLLISFDRLTRFKLTKEKYFRVFSDIITSNLIEPVYRKHHLESMPAKEVTGIAVEVINESLKELTQTSSYDDYFNNLLKNYENSIFINDDETQDYLNNKIDYMSLISLIDDNCVVNLRWLKAISSKENMLKLRRQYCLKLPIQKVLLVEGITEEILLPAFSKFLGFDFYKEGIQVIPAGGKNQVVKMYYKLIEELKIPIFLLLDKDAESNLKQIKPKLRVRDKIHLVTCGEFEDLLPRPLIIKTVNSELNNFASISNSDFDNSIPNAKNLENIFKTKGMHEFKKADFAKLVRENISDSTDISAEIASIILEIRESKVIL